MRKMQERNNIGKVILTTEPMPEEEKKEEAKKEDKKEDKKKEDKKKDDKKKDDGKKEEKKDDKKKEEPKKEEKKEEPKKEEEKNEEAKKEEKWEGKMDSQADQQQGVCVLGAGEVAGMSLVVELQGDGGGVVAKMGRSWEKLEIITPVSVFYLPSASPTGWFTQAWLLPPPVSSSVPHIYLFKKMFF